MIQCPLIRKSICY